MPPRKWSDLLARTHSPEQIADMRRQTREELKAEFLEQCLVALWASSGKSDAEIAQAWGTLRPAFEAAEVGDGPLLQVLRHWVDLLGGEVEVWVRFGDRRALLGDTYRDAVGGEFRGARGDPLENVESGPVQPPRVRWK